MSSASVFQPLQGQQYINLTTFRKSGEGVATPVWFAIEGEMIYIVTQQDSGKVKRIRNNSRITMAASDSRGQVKPGTPTIEGHATVTALTAGGPGDRALRGKYGWMYQAFGWFWSLRRITAVILEVHPA